MSNSMNGSRYNNSRNRVAESERPVITAPYNFIEINSTDIFSPYLGESE